MTIKQALVCAVQRLESAGVPDPLIDAEWILAHVTGLERLTLRLSGPDELTTEQEQRFSSLLLSRTRRQPLQYLLGTQGFYGLSLKADGRALIPRQETETLCEVGIRHLLTFGTGARPSVLDLCTGGGAVAAAVKRECPFALVEACDVSADALSLARENAARLKLDIAFHQGDLFSPVKNRRFDLILSNPPYIPTRDLETLQAEVRWEPRMALDGGENGLDFYRRIAAQAAGHLTTRGMLAVEAGDGQAREIAAIFAEAGLQEVRAYNDLYGRPRVLRARAADFT